MKELNKLNIELIQIEDQIEELYARKREIKANIKKCYERILESARTTGKTINDFEEV